MNEVKKILVPVDFSENSHKIVESAANLAAQLEAEVTLVFVVQSFADYSGFFVPHVPLAQFEDEMTQGARKKMDEFLAAHQHPGVTIKGEILKGDVVEEINRFAADEKVDLIVMGTHGYKGLEKILFGSVAEQVVKTAPCPVLTINPYR